MKIFLRSGIIKNFRRTIALVFLTGYQVSTSWGQGVTITPTSASVVAEGEVNEISLRSAVVPNIIGLRLGGTLQSPVAVGSGVNLVQLNGGGYNGSAFTTTRAGIFFLTTQPWSTTANGTRIQFTTTPNDNIFPIQQVTIDHTGFVGIGSSEPKSPLHIYRGSSNITPSGGAKIFVEDIDHTYIALGTTDNKESGILFGKTSFGSASGGIIYDSNRNLQFRTSTNDTRMTVTEAGLVGVGITSPASRFHVSAGISGVTPHANAKIFAEGDQATYINLGTPDDRESGILFGRPSFGSTSGGIIYDVDRNLHFRTSTNDTRMLVTEAGKVGIGNANPAAKLDVVGDVRVSLMTTNATTSVSYDPFNRQNNSYHVINTFGGATVFVRGISVASSGTLLYLIVAGDGTVILQDDRATDDANRILTNDNDDITISGQGSAILIYTDGWRVLSFTK